MASDRQLLHKASETSQAGAGEPLPRRKTCTGYTIYKILTIIYAVFYVLIGVLLLALGIWITVVKREYESIADAVTGPAALCIVAGLIIIVSAVVGCVGAVADRLWPLRIFLGIIVLVFVIQVVVGILAYVYREEAIQNLGNRLLVTVQRYHTDSSVEYAINKLQQEKRCCGIKGYQDWESNAAYSCSANSRESCSVPDSCCLVEEKNCGFNVRRSGSLGKINTQGCEVSLSNWIEHHLDILGATALGLAILHILGMFVIYMMITKVEDRIRLFKYRKRFYQS